MLNLEPVKKIYWCKMLIVSVKIK